LYEVEPEGIFVGKMRNCKLLQSSCTHIPIQKPVIKSSQRENRFSLPTLNKEGRGGDGFEEETLKDMFCRSSNREK
jgi:hypothetical protein